MPEVDAVLGNEEKLKSASYRALPDFGVSADEKLRVNDIMSVRETAPQMVKLIDGHVRAFIQVQNGCDHRCTFCIIPYGRGNSRSVPMGAVVDQARMLAENGYREIVLTGVDATSYGADLPGAPTLGLLAKTLSETGAGNPASASLLDRQHRGGQPSDGPDRRRAALHAASASVAAAWRRHDPEAHEAPP